MGNPRGFIEVKRKGADNRPVDERIQDFSEVEQTLNTEDRILQASRCMDCGIPFCHWACPINSRIPEWQDALYRENLKESIDILQLTNDFPEFTGRICPAPCEKSCVLAIHEEAVTIRENEAAIAERSYDAGLIQAKPPQKRTGKKVAVIGSGPAGLTIASRLNRMGHQVTVFEKDEKIGGLLRFGIPDFKLHKSVIDRRLDILKEEGIKFRTKVNVGTDISPEELKKKYDAICLAIGAMQARNINVPGREMEGIYFAMDFLTQQNRIIAGKNFSGKKKISAKNKHVIVIGGGDTGSDCVGTSIRQGAKSVKQIEILPEPPLTRKEDNPWPFWPNTLRTSSSQQEGCERIWATSTKRFISENNKLNQIETIKVRWEQDNRGKYIMIEEPGSLEIHKADIILLALGFTQPVHEGLLENLGLKYDERGNILTDNQSATTKAKFFAAGDAADGASLVVSAIASGQDAAESIHLYLTES
ncbi:MAG: glutamate synthase subunit beta [Bacteroidales bacterium]|nr:glutamate synthase subunit beta [Bacteroidales bacterium]